MNFLNTRSRRLDKSTLLSFVVPIYNEEEGLESLFARMTAVVDALPVNCEIILINDGSIDRSLEIMENFVRRDSRFRIVELSRNFGHQMAVSAGLSTVRGDVVAILDGDLQDPPELVGRMLRRWNEGIDLIYGQRRNRPGESWFKLTTAKIYYHILSILSDCHIPKDTGDFRVVDRRVVEVINLMPERHRFLRGMFAWAGFKQEAFLYDRDVRAEGETKFPFIKMLRFSIDGIVSFSVKPLRWVLWTGLSLTVFSMASGAYLLYLRLLRPNNFPSGVVGMFVTMLLFFGITFVFLGVIGEYVARIYQNSLRRPSYLIREIVQAPTPVEVRAAGSQDVLVPRV